MTPLQIEARAAWAQLLNSAEQPQPLGKISHWTTPSKGDRFTHIPIDGGVLVCDRITQKGDGTISLWCQGQKYPLAECEPVGIWKALLEQFVEDLAHATDWDEVIGITAGLDLGQKAAIWMACTKDQRERMRRMKDAQSQAA
jgi:hypothetical protein